MSHTTAIVHAPGETDAQLRVLEQKLQRFLDEMGFLRTKIYINLYPEFYLLGIENEVVPSTLVIGWGLPEKPIWDQWAFSIKTSAVIRLFVAIDLYQSCGAHGRVVTPPESKTRRYWRHKSWRSKCKLFLRGCYVSSIVPYGMRRIPIYHEYAHDYPVTDRYILIPGNPDEIEIVRLIFSLFVDHDYTLTELANLLNAQRVPAPHLASTWSMKKLKTMMASAVYIGSNQYAACVQHHVFPALIERSIFCAAMAKIYNKSAFSAG